MKQGRNLMDLAAELTRQQSVKRDYIVPSTKLAMKEGKTLSFTNGHVNDFNVNETAHDQIATRLDIPRKYYDRMRTDSPALLDANVNHWLSKYDDSLMVRTLDGKARALLSNRYRCLDNADLAEIALPRLIKAGAKIESCEVTERRLYIKAVTERITLNVKPGDDVQAGIVISNSEIGQGSLSIQPLIFRLVCSNGMIVNKAGMRKAHIGRSIGDDLEGLTQFYTDATRKADDKAFWMKVGDTLDGVFSDIGFESIVRKFATTLEAKIEKPVIEVIELAQKRFNLSESEGQSVLTHLIQGGDLNQFGLINAITRTAQDVESYDRATELESLGGQILELAPTDWKTLAMAA